MDSLYFTAGILIPFKVISQNSIMFVKKVLKSVAYSIH
jgi:hypothetical protein